MPFILVATFTMLNLFIAIIVNTMQTVQGDQRKSSERGTLTEAVHDESTQQHPDLTEVQRKDRRLRENLRALHREIVELRETLQRQR